MHLIKISINRLLFIMLCLCLVVFPINYTLVLFFRVLDLFFIILFFSFIVTNPKIDKNLLTVFLLAIVLFSISNIIKVLENKSLELIRLGFVYKYLFIFIVPWIVVSIVKTNKQIYIINLLLLVAYIFLSSWPYIYLSLLSSGFISGSLRPSFPLSNNYTYSDAHLYSSYLGYFFVVYVFYFRKYFRHNIVLSCLIIINGFIGLILTGSRTGLVLVGLASLFYVIYSIVELFFIKNKLSIRKNKAIYVMLSLLVFLFLLILLKPYINLFLNNYENLIIRAFNFKLAEDQSSLGRIRKLMIAINDAEYSGLLLGSGFCSSLVWYDGIFSILMAYGGLLFIVSIFIFYYLIVVKVILNSINQKDALFFLLFVILYLVSNIVSEYIFVSRNAFPILVMLSILYINILNKKIICGKTKK